MARMKVTPRQEERCGGKSTTDKGSCKGGRKGEGGPIAGAPPTLATEAPPQAEEIMRRITEAGKLKGVGRSPLSLPTWQLAQMAGPSTLGKEEPARRKLQPTVGGKPPRRNSSRLVRSRRPGSTSLAQLLFERSGGSKRAQSSSFRNSPSCS